MIIVNFIGNEVEKYIRGLDQYDRGQILCISGLDLPKFVEVQFSLQETGGLAERIVGITTDGVTEVEIPNYMLTNNDATSDYEIYAFVYVTNETSAETVYKITMEVNSRPKPNPYDTPEDIGMFNRVIEVMKDSVTAAENAAGTSEKNAQKTGEDRKAIEEMVGTITGIEQQVQDVKEYAGQAKTAAENALLSEQESKKSEETSLQHRTGAETAENNAELAESNAKKSEQAVERAKQLVMQMGQEVLQDKNKVAEKVEAFNKVVTDAVDAVGAVKTDAVNTIGTKGTEQIKKVSDEGAKQVKAVEGKGQEVLQSIPEDFTTQMVSKLDKQQGAENSGKILQIGEDGLIIPVEKPNDGGEKDYELISEITTSQEVSVLYINGFKKQFTEFILYITCPKAEQISVYIQRIFQNSKYGKAVVLYNISDAGKEIESVAKIELLAEKIEFVDCASNKYNSANIQRNYNNKYNDNTPIEKTSFKEIGISCTGAFKIPIGTKITLIGR